MIEHIQNFFETLLGTVLPQWFYNAFGIVILMAMLLTFLKLVFPKLSKYVWISVLAITLGYLVYEIIPFWGVGTAGFGGIAYAH